MCERGRLINLSFCWVVFFRFCCITWGLRFLDQHNFLWKCIFLNWTHAHLWYFYSCLGRVEISIRRKIFLSLKNWKRIMTLFSNGKEFKRPRQFWNESQLRPNPLQNHLQNGKKIYIYIYRPLFTAPLSIPLCTLFCTHIVASMYHWSFLERGKKWRPVTRACRSLTTACPYSWTRSTNRLIGFF